MNAFVNKHCTIII